MNRAVALYGTSSNYLPNASELELIRGFDPVVNEYLDLDDEGLNAHASAVDLAAKRFAGQQVPKEHLVGAVNTLYGKQIGDGKSVADAFVSPDNKGLVFSLNVDQPDGSTSRKPLTKYRLTEEDGDNEVKSVPLSALAGDISMRARLIRSIKAARVSLGDMTPVAKLAAKNKLMEQRKFDKSKLNEQREYDAGLKKIEHSFDLKKQEEEYRLKALQDGTDNFDKEKKLRDAYVKQSGEYIKVRDSYGRVLQSAKKPSAAGDLALVFNYMKILDPGSVVRESEFATASNAAGVPDRIRNTYNRVLNGERLADNQRADFVDRAKKLYRGMENQHKRRVGSYEKLATSYGLNSKNILLDLSLAEGESMQQAGISEDISSLSDDELLRLLGEADHATK